VIVSEGYKVGTPPVTNDVVQTGQYRINQIVFERSPEHNMIRIVAYDHSRDLDRQCRWQMLYTSQNVFWLVQEVCARAGLTSYNVPSTSNTAQLVPTFILHAGQTYRAALNEICGTYGLWYFMDQTETLIFKELTASDPIVWTYQPEIESLAFGADDMRGNHIIVSGKPPSGGGPLSLTEGEAYDDSNLSLVQVERLIHHVDQKLTTTAQCVAKASALLLQEQRIQTAHMIIVPANPALQLYDGVTVTDYNAPNGSGQTANCRIIESTVMFEAQKAIFEHHIALEGL
jgi:hypothetical protein